mmetsp:Transcript_6300/g.24299  ORF Transcript_6300/g.24299 Transcript_6300/m.24299 type:complete len:236 (-) Transcript_6300:682-1389(-)
MPRPGAALRLAATVPVKTDPSVPFTAVPFTSVPFVALPELPSLPSLCANAATYATGRSTSSRAESPAGARPLSASSACGWSYPIRPPRLIPTDVPSKRPPKFAVRLGSALTTTVSPELRLTVTTSSRGSASRASHLDAPVSDDEPTLTPTMTCLSVTAAKAPRGRTSLAPATKHSRANRPPAAYWCNSRAIASTPLNGRRGSKWLAGGGRGGRSRGVRTTPPLPGRRIIRSAYPD